MSRVFLFKQKTAYDMRISDWSSDVCSSDLFGGGGYWSSTRALYHGRLKLRDAASEAIDKSIFGPGTAGDFNKLTVQISRLTALRARLRLFVGPGAQFPDRHLHPPTQPAPTVYTPGRPYPTRSLPVYSGT